MSNNNEVYKTAAATTAICVATNFILQYGVGVIAWARQPDVLVEEKAYLKENMEILRKNFTK